MGYCLLSVVPLRVGIFGSLLPLGTTGSQKYANFITFRTASFKQTPCNVYPNPTRWTSHCQWQPHTLGLFICDRVANDTIS